MYKDVLLSNRGLFLYFSCFFFFYITASHADEIIICPDCREKSIQEAVARSRPGDKIRLRPGIYRESGILIDRSLSIEGEAGAVIDGEKKGTILKIQAENVSISNLKIINAGHSFTQEFAGILIVQSKNFTIKNLDLQKMYYGIKVESSSIGLIENNTVSSVNLSEAGSGNGIHVWSSSHVQIINNNLHNMRDGIYFEFVENSTITGNRSHNNIRYGLHFMFSHHNSYKENIFEQNGAGVAVMFSKFTEMKNNTFKNNWGSASYGLLLKEIYDAEIENNRFIRNTIAVNIEGSTRIQYTGNKFEGNGWGIRVIGACYQNVFKRNDFLGNALDVSYNSKANDNEFSGNFWSSYTGYDLDKNGVGDVPHRPVKLFSFIVNRTPEAIVLLRSMFVDLINFSEKVSPVFTPDDIIDENPAMKAFE